MKTSTALCALALLVAAIGCGGAGTPSVEEPAVEGPAAELVGAWISTDIQERFGSSCPWIIELFADGSLETNQLSDDRGQQCVFARVPYQLEADREPPMLHVGGQLSHCVYEREGKHLKLVCEDHGLPEPEADDWFVFEPLKIERETTLNGLTGTWLLGAFMGAPLVITIDEQGNFESRVDEGSSGDGMGETKIEIVDENRLTLESDTREENCLFRATRHRLTLRCAPAADGWPNAFYDPNVEPSANETMVFFRLSTEVEKREK